MEFRKKISQAEREFPPNELVKQKEGEEWEVRLKNLYKDIKKGKKSPKIHNFIFPMDFPYKGFRKMLDEIDKLCEKYENIFGFRPRYRLTKFALKITLQFRILTQDSELIFEHQPKFAAEIYREIYEIRGSNS